MSDSCIRVKWGILGCARIAEECTLPAMLCAYNAVPFAIAGRNPDRVRLFKERYGFERAYGDYTSLLDDPDVEAVYVPLPNNLHKEWIIKALEHGKAVLCEKPIAMTPDELQEIMDASKKYERPVMEAFAFRQSIAVKKINEIIASGAIGELKTIFTRVSFMLSKPDDFRLEKNMGGGSVYDIGSYNINFINMIMKTAPKKIYAAAGMHKNNVDMDCDCIFTYDNGVRAFSHCAMNTPVYDDYSVTGTEGTIDFPYDLNAYGELRLTVSNESGETVYKFNVQNVYQSEIEQFSRVVSEGEKQELSLEESMENLETVTRVLELLEKQE